MNVDNAYFELLQHILDHGTRKADRTGTGTLSVFGYQMRLDMADGFPLLTTKKLHTKSIFAELLWFLRGDTNIRWLQEQGVTIWDEWADKNGELGPVYGKQWRNWMGILCETHESLDDALDEPIDAPKDGAYTCRVVRKSDDGKYIVMDTRVIDQIEALIKGLRSNPDSRRHIVSVWNVTDASLMALPPCHLLQQYYVIDGRLSLQVYQRSADTFLGLPFNLASYALLLHMVAQQTGYQPGELIYTLGDAHIYLNHLEQVHEQLSRTPRPLPVLALDKVDDIDSYTLDHIRITGYDPHPAIKAAVAV